MKKTLKRIAPAIMAAVMLMQTNSFAASAYFSDVTSRYDWAQEAIDALHEKGVISGFNDGYFRPAYPIRRCDFTVMLYGRFGTEGTYDAALPEDVSNGIYYETAYKWAVAQGLYTEGQPFAPQEYITRQEAFYCLYKSLETEGFITYNNKTTTLSNFLDAPDVDADKREALSTLASLGVISGSNGLLLPKNTLTRAEMAIIFYKADKLEVDSAFDGIDKNVETNLDVSSVDKRYNITTSTTAKYLVDAKEAALSDENIDIEEGGKSAIVVQNGGKLDVSSAQIKKTGNSISSVNTGKSGVNSAIVVRNGSTLGLDGVTLDTKGDYANGITVFDNNNTVNIENSNITTSKYTDSKPVSISGSANLSLTGSTIESKGDNCEAIHSDDKNVSINISGSEIKSNGKDATAISASGTLTSDESIITSEKGVGLTALNDSNIELNNTTINAAGALISIAMGYGEHADYRMSNTTKITNSDLTTEGKGPVIEFTNINSDVYISGSKLSSNGTLFKSKIVSGINGGRWGSDVSITLDNQDAVGDVEAQNTASMSLTLRNASHLKGAINPQNSGHVDLYLESPDDILELTGDCYVRVFQNHGDYGFNNITGETYNIYYEGSAFENSWLNNQNYPLANGGSLIPY